MGRPCPLYCTFCCWTRHSEHFQCGLVLNFHHFRRNWSSRRRQHAPSIDRAAIGNTCAIGQALESPVVGVYVYITRLQVPQETCQTQKSEQSLHTTSKSWYLRSGAILQAVVVSSKLLLHNRLPVLIRKSVQSWSFLACWTPNCNTLSIV